MSFNLYLGSFDGPRCVFKAKKSNLKNTYDLIQTPTSVTRQILEFEEKHGFYPALNDYFLWVKDKFYNDWELFEDHKKRIIQWCFEEAKVFNTSLHFYTV